MITATQSPLTATQVATRTGIDLVTALGAAPATDDLLLLHDTSAGARVSVTVANVASTVSSVVGLAGLTDNRLLRADGTAAAQSSPVTLDDTGAMTGLASVATPIVQASSSAGLDIRNSGGTSVLLLGPGPGTGATFAGGVNVTGTVSVDAIVELTPSAGVTVESVLIDGGAISAVTQLDVDNLRLDGSTLSTTSGSLTLTPTGTTVTVTAGKTLATDTIAETTPAAGVTVDGVLLKDSTVTAPFAVLGGAGGAPASLHVTNVTSNAQLRISRTGTSTSDWYIYANSNNLLFAPTAAGVPGTTALTLSTTALNLATGVTLQVNGTQVLTSRRTGWGAPTGTATRTAFATGSVTLDQLAERVKALIDDLTTHGVIGA